jgi:hypothetical protein
VSASGDRPGRSACPDAGPGADTRADGRCPSTERCPLVSAVRVIVWSRRRVWTLGAHGLDAGSSWWTPVWTGSGHGECGPPEHAPGVSAAALVRGRLWTWPPVDAVAVVDAAVRRVCSGHHRPDARPHHGSVAHGGNRGPSGPDSDGGHELGRRVRAVRPRGMLRRLPAQRGFRPTAVVRGGPSGTGATGTRRARPASRNLVRAWRRWSPARPEGEAVRGNHLPRRQGPQARGSCIHDPIRLYGRVRE